MRITHRDTDIRMAENTLQHNVITATHHKMAGKGMA